MRLIGTAFVVSVSAVLNMSAIAADDAAPDVLSSLNPGLPPGTTPPVDDGPHDSAGFYTVMARAQKEQGRAYVEFTVRKDGSVAQPSLTKSTGFADLDIAAIQAVESWRYKPATASGNAIEVRWKANVDFQLGFTQPIPIGSPHDANGFYPANARLFHEKGTVQVTYLVTEDGRVDDPVVVKSSDFADLDKAALQAVRTWRYLPATRDGKPIEVRGHSSIGFGIPDDYGLPLGMRYNTEFKVGSFSPSILAAAKDDGRVVLSLIVGTDETTSDVTLVQSSGDAGLDAKVIESVRKARFHPTIRKGEPITSLISIAVKVYPPPAPPNPAVSTPPTP
jgi:TonB family protein